MMTVEQIADEIDRKIQRFKARPHDGDLLEEVTRDVGDFRRLFPSKVRGNWYDPELYDRSNLTSAKQMEGEIRRAVEGFLASPHNALAMQRLMDAVCTFHRQYPERSKKMWSEFIPHLRRRHGEEIAKLCVATFLTE